MNADGTFLSQDFGATINITGTYLMESVSVSGNVRTLKIHFTYSGSMNDYVLAKVTDGNTYESVYTTLLPYPTTISTGDLSYKEFTLQ
ncbi:MAG: hypothetical protein A2064_09030 [Spirochaetes bacterium GWB1_66_5]|nr:MAG: hypothetical protein A2064_09030 [Spirochaetes bacterium GWB1_66_5]